MAFMTSFIGCASNDNQLTEALRKNPKIIFAVIEESPDQFIEVVNRAAQKAQQKQYEKQIAEMKNEQDKDLKSPKQPKHSSDKRLVDDDGGKIIIVEYADFQCPACKMAYPSALYLEAIRLQDKTELPPKKWARKS